MKTASAYSYCNCKSYISGEGLMLNKQYWTFLKASVLSVIFNTEAFGKIISIYITLLSVYFCHIGGLGKKTPYKQPVRLG